MPLRPSDYITPGGGALGGLFGGLNEGLTNALQEIQKYKKENEELQREKAQNEVVANYARQPTWVVDPQTGQYSQKGKPLMSNEEWIKYQKSSPAQQSGMIKGYTFQMAQDMKNESAASRAENAYLRTAIAFGRQNLSPPTVSTIPDPTGGPPIKVLTTPKGGTQQIKTPQPKVPALTKDEKELLSWAQGRTGDPTDSLTQKSTLRQKLPSDLQAAYDWATNPKNVKDPNLTGVWNSIKQSIIKRMAAAPAATQSSASGDTEE